MLGQISKITAADLAKPTTEGVDMAAGSEVIVTAPFDGSEVGAIETDEQM